MDTSIVKDTLKVAFSNFIILLSSACTGFVIPMILGATDYGYYKIFVLYSTYTALLHFGFVDGVLILDGGKSYSNLNRMQYRANSQFFILFQFLIAILLALISFFVNSYFNKVLFISLGMYAFLINVMTYYQFISQATMKFTQLSLAQIIQAMLNVILILFLYLIYKLNFINKPGFLPCISILLIVLLLLCVWYIYTYRDITFGNRNKIFKTYRIIFKYFRAGVYITISYQVSMLLVNLDNQFVSWFFSAYQYGIYAFAYSLISVINTILSSVSAVLLPHLKQMSLKKIIKIYSPITSYILLVVFLLFGGYFPLELVIKIFLPKYIGSLVYFRILLPSIVINCCISLIIFTYYNALSKSKIYFKIIVLVLFISFMVYSMCYYMFKSVVAIALGSLIALIIWIAISEGILINKYKMKWIKNTIYMILMIIIFYCCSFSNNLIFGEFLYMLFYVFISYILFKLIIIKCYKRGIQFIKKRA